MAFYDTTWYCNSVGYAAVTARPQNTAVAAGVVRKQATTPSVGNERCFVCIVAGTTANVTDATWTLTRGAKTTDGTVTWQECTGASAVNGDLTNTVTWTTAKATGTPTLGAIIKRNNGASYQICTTAGTMAASEPSFSDTAGVTTNDGTSVWTSLGPVGNFGAGGAPFARLQAATGTNWAGPGHTVYVGDNHAESQASNIAVSFSGASAATPTKIVCHNHSGSYPPATGDITTGATVSTTTTGTITLSGSFSYWYGIAFIAGVGSSGVHSISLGGNPVFFDNCSFQIATTGPNTNIQISFAASAVAFLNNCPVKFGQALHNCGLAGGTTVYWQNTSPMLMAGSTVPSVGFFNPNSSGSVGGGVVVEGCDLSTLTGPLVTLQNPYSGNFLFKDCKLSSATAATPIASGGFGTSDLTVQTVRCDSGAGYYKSSRHNMEGNEFTDTSVVRTGGAIDPTGQRQSRKITTTVNSAWQQPFRAEPFAIWNAVTGANVGVTLYGLVNAAAVPNNDEFWFDAEYLGSGSTPQGSFSFGTKSNFLATGSALTADTSAWDSLVTARANSTLYTIGAVIKVASNPGRVFICTAVTGNNAASEPGGYASAVDGGSVTDGQATFRAACRFKQTLTLSSPQPGLQGYLHARVKAAKVSTTFYVDPQVYLS